MRGASEQLAALNSELEALLYSVSHDLRAPLRSIRGFSEVVLQKYGACMDEQGQEFLRRVGDACGQMDRQIEDLAKLSRANRVEMSKSEVDLTALAVKTAEQVRRKHPNHEVEFRAETGLRGEGDERLLGMALESLLDNAWKFTRQRPDAEVQFGRGAGKQKQAFFVRDNGVGFKTEHADKLFTAFRKLHSPEEFEGNGIGLALVRRIVTRHGGRVWAEGTPGKGAVFYFSLPEVQAR